MEEILKTTLLEFEKSTFIIDLVKHRNGKQYIRILQTIQDEERDNKRIIKINPALLGDIISVLNVYQELIPSRTDQQSTKELVETSMDRENTLYASEKSEIQNRYLKGIAIADLAIQFNCKEELIEQVLYNSNIAIVDNKLPKAFRYKKFRHRKS